MSDVEAAESGHQNDRELRFGSTDVRHIPEPLINTLVQTRHGLNSGAIDELKTSLVVRGPNGEVIDTDLINAVSVADLSAEAAKAYLARINLAREKNYKLSKMKSYQTETGERRYAFLIAGHHRKEGVRQIGRDEGVDPNKVFIAATVYTDITYDEAARKQLTENSSRAQISKHEEAELIVDMFRLNAADAKAAGRTYSENDCAKDLGMPKYKVTRALAYELLPDELKTLVSMGEKRGGLSYVLATRDLSRYQVKLKEYAEVRYNAVPRRLDLGRFKTPDEYANHELFTFTITLLERMLKAGSRTGSRRLDDDEGSLSLVSVRRVIEYIEERIAIAQSGINEVRAEQLKARQAQKRQAMIDAGELDEAELLDDAVEEIVEVQGEFDLGIDFELLNEVFRDPDGQRGRSLEALVTRAAGMLAFAAAVSPKTLEKLRHRFDSGDARAAGKLFLQIADGSFDDEI